MRFLILDAYTDEPSGLGVPPYIGTYPRYYFGAVIKEGHEAHYITIDDLRYFCKEKEREKSKGEFLKNKYDKEFLRKEEVKTNIRIYNLTKRIDETELLLKSSDFLIVISGVQTPGKYLSAFPGILKEIVFLLDSLPDELKTYKTILAGPGADIGEGLFGGTKSYSKKYEIFFDYVVRDFEYKLGTLLKNNFKDYIPERTELSYSKIKEISVLGSKLISYLSRQKLSRPLNQHMIEIETMKGCRSKTTCSFCTEKIKNPFVEVRPVKDIVEEIMAISNAGLKNFRIGKQTCFYSYGSNEALKKLLSNAKKYSEILHIDNVNPKFVNEEKTKTIVKYTTPGNVAAFGVESFDERVIKLNNLNTTPDETFNAIKIINKFGSKRGYNGMPFFLPGLNILFGLNGESKKTHEENMFWLKKILDSDLLLRRLNIREVVVFDKTPLDIGVGTKFLRKNKKYYWKWRNEIRQKIDVPMLKKVLPVGTVLRELYTEIHDGKHTFCRQLGTYPIVVGINERLKLNKKIDVKITGHMKRSVIGKPINFD